MTRKVYTSAFRNDLWKFTKRKQTCFKKRKIKRKRKRKRKRKLTIVRLSRVTLIEEDCRIQKRPYEDRRRPKQQQQMTDLVNWSIIRPTLQATFVHHLWLSRKQWPVDYSIFLSDH